jgi:hypothetical protein
VACEKGKTYLKCLIKVSNRSHLTFRTTAFFYHKHEISGDEYQFRKKWFQNAGHIKVKKSFTGTRRPANR